MTGIIIKSQIRKKVKELDEQGIIGNVAEEVEEALEKKTEEVLKKAIERAKANQRKTLLARDL
jgi:histone H3/H4